MQSLFDHHEAAIAALFRVVNRYVVKLAPMPGVFPVGSRRQSPIRPKVQIGKEKPLGGRCCTILHGNITLVSERGAPNTVATLASRQAHDTTL